MTTTIEQDEIQAARQQGMAEAEALDLRLRAAELEEREKRLAELAWRPHEGGNDVDAVEDSLRVIQLEARVSELNTYVRSVHDSLPWRIIQKFRGLLGRSW